MNAFNFHVGDEIKLVKKFDDDSPYEEWESPVGCPPLDVGTKGTIISVKNNHVVVEIVNPKTNKSVSINVYNKDVDYVEKSQKLDCLKIVRKAAVAA